MAVNETNAQKINDVYSELAAKTASNTQEIAEAMMRTASIANSAGMGFETAAAFLAKGIETTREPAENIGTAMKTVIARFSEMKKAMGDLATTEDGEVISVNRVETALKSAGVELRKSSGEFRDLDEVFVELSSKWDLLDLMTRRYIATQAAGSRQQSRFIAFMSDYARTQELLSYTTDSAGASQKQFDKTLESLDSKLNKLKNTWDAFTQGIANDTIIKTAVDLLNGLLTALNNIADSFGPLSGITRVIALFLGFKAVRKLLEGATTSFKDFAARVKEEGASAFWTKASKKEREESKEDNRKRGKEDERAYQEGREEARREAEAEEKVRDAASEEVPLMVPRPPVTRQDIVNVTPPLSDSEIDAILESKGVKKHGKDGYSNKQRKAFRRSLLGTAEGGANRKAKEAGSEYIGDLVEQARAAQEAEIEQEIQYVQAQLKDAKEAAEKAAREAEKKDKEAGSEYIGDLVEQAQAAQEAEIEQETGIRGKIGAILNSKVTLLSGLTAAITTWQTVWGIVAGISSFAKQAQEEEYKLQQEVIATTKAYLEENEALKEQQKAYKEALEGYDDTAEAKDKYRKATLELASALGVEISASDLLAGNLDKINKQLTESQLAKSAQTISEIKQGIDAAQKIADTNRQHAQYWEAGGGLGSYYLQKIGGVDIQTARERQSEAESTVKELTQQLLEESSQATLLEARQALGINGSAVTYTQYEQLRKKFKENVESDYFSEEQITAYFNSLLSATEGRFELIRQAEEQFEKRFINELTIPNNIDSLLRRIRDEGNTALLSQMVITEETTKNLDKEYERIKQINKLNQFSQREDYLGQASSLIEQGEEWDKIDDTLKINVLKDLGLIDKAVDGISSSQKEWNRLLNIGATRTQKLLFLYDKAIERSQLALDSSKKRVSEITNINDEINKLTTAQDNIKIRFDNESRLRYVQQLLQQINYGDIGDLDVSKLKSDDFISQFIPSLTNVVSERLFKFTAGSMISAEDLFKGAESMSEARKSRLSRVVEYAPGKTIVEYSNQGELDRLDEILQDLKSALFDGGGQWYTELLQISQQYEKNAATIEKHTEQLIDLEKEQTYSSVAYIDYLQAKRAEIESAAFSRAASSELASFFSNLVTGELPDISGNENLIDMMTQLASSDGLFKNAYEQWIYDAQYWGREASSIFFNEVEAETIKRASEVQKNQKEIDEQRLKTSQDLQLEFEQKYRKALQDKVGQDGTTGLTALKGAFTAAAFDVEEKDIQSFEDLVNLLSQMGESQSEDFFTNLKTALGDNSTLFYLIKDKANEFAEALNDIDTYGEKLSKNDYGMAAAKDNFSTVTEAVNSAITAFSSLAEVLAKVGENFIISASDAAELAKAYPGILKNATDLHNGTIQLNEQTVKSVIEGQKAQIEAIKDKRLAEIEAAESSIRVQIKQKEQELKIWENAENGKVTLSEDEANMIADIGDQLVEALAKDGQTEIVNRKLANLIIQKDQEGLNAELTALFGEESENSANFVKVLYQQYWELVDGNNKKLLNSISEVLKAYELVEQVANGTISAEQATKMIDSLERPFTDRKFAKFTTEDTKSINKYLSALISDAMESGILYFQNISTSGTSAITSGLTSEQIQSRKTSLQNDIDSLNESLASLNDERALLENAFNIYTDAADSAISGVGGDSYKNAKLWENTLSQFYNLLQSLKHLEEEQSKLEAEYNDLLKKRNATEADFYTNRVSALQNYTAQFYGQEQLDKAARQQAQNLLAGNSDLLKYANYDIAKNQITIDQAAINKITDETLGERVTKFISKLEEVQTTRRDALSSLTTIKESIATLIEQGRDQYISLINKTVEALKYERQEEIDKLSDINTSIKEANEDLINSIEKNISKLRQNRQNQKTEEELANKRMRLLYTQQRTDLTNDSKTLLSLQKDLAQSTEDYQDSLIDQRLKDIQESNTEASTQREKQIEIMQKDLEASEKSGELVKKATDLVDGALKEGDTIGNNSLMELLKKADNWNTKSTAEQEKWLADILEETSSAKGYKSVQAYLESNGISKDINSAIPQLVSGISSGIKNSLTIDVPNVAVTVHVDKEGAVSTKQTPLGSTDGNTSESKGSFWKDFSSQVMGLPRAAASGTDSSANNKANKLENFDSEMQKWLEKITLHMPSIVKSTIKKEAINTLYDFVYTRPQSQASIDNINNFKNVDKEGTEKIIDLLSKGGALYYDHFMKQYKDKVFADGGIVNFTGPAWLDGTYANPEYVLDNARLKSVIQLVNTSADLARELGDTTNTSVNIPITINVDKIDSDYDIDQVVEKVKDDIVEIFRYKNITII